MDLLNCIRKIFDKTKEIEETEIRVIKDEKDVIKPQELKKGDITGGIILRKPFKYIESQNQGFINEILESSPTVNNLYEELKVEKKKDLAKLSVNKEWYNDPDYSYYDREDTFMYEFSKVETYLYDKLIQKLDDKLGEQHDNLYKSFVKEGVPCRYLVSDKNAAVSYYATDSGTIFSDEGYPKYIRANFKHNYRKSEVDSMDLLLDKGLAVPRVSITSEIGNPMIFEGGDIRQMPEYKLWFVGGGIVSGTQPGYDNGRQFFLDELAENFAREVRTPVIPLKLLTYEYYHLDCCFLPLPNGIDKKPWAVIYEGTPASPTMDKNSFAILRKLYGEDHLIKITEKEAKLFATNSVTIENAKGEKCIFSPANAFSKTSKDKLESLGFKLIEIPYEFFSIGLGSLRCTCLEVPKSLNSVLFKAQDDIRIHHQANFLKEKNRMLFYDSKTKEFVMGRAIPKSEFSFK